MNLKELLNIAKQNLVDLSSLENPDFRLEQAEYNEEKKEWEIVVSYLVENTNARLSALAALTSEFKYYRLYKRLRINHDNQIVGFYIYNNKNDSN